jgi:hypothetical protein
MAEQCPELTDRQPVEMTRHAVAYLDILGYRNLIREAFSNHRGNEELQKLRRAWDRSSVAAHSKQGCAAPRKARFFTDNVVIAEEVGFGGDHFTLHGLTCQLALLQWELISEGYFLRGAIELGDLYIDDEIVFGPSLLDAYEAENTIAKWPRIVLAKGARQCANKDIHGDCDLSLVCDADQQLSVDYLSQTVFIAGGCDRPFHEIVDEHKEIVTRQLSQFRSDPETWMKYYWVAQYHNSFCDKFEQYLASDARIEAELLIHRPVIHSEAPRFGGCE